MVRGREGAKHKHRGWEEEEERWSRLAVYRLKGSGLRV